MITRTKAFTYAILSSILLIVYLICDSQWWTMDWIFMLPIGFFVMVFFLVRIIKNILFWIRKRNDLKYSWTPLFIQVAAVIITCFIPSYNKNKKYYWGTTNLALIKQSGCNCNLYVEHYNVFDQGAFGTGLNSAYLTDSLNFRIFLGVYDEGNERFEVKCLGDSIVIEKTSTEGIDLRWNDPLLQDKKIYSLKDLKKSKRFE